MNVRAKDRENSPLDAIKPIVDISQIGHLSRDSSFSRPRSASYYDVFHEFSPP
jgi:hypothetical protein